MKIVKGWRRISNQGGFVNETTDQTLTVEKTEFGEHYHVLLFSAQRTDDTEGKKISPEYSTEAKAETFAMNWMAKNPKGTN